MPMRYPAAMWVPWRYQGSDGGVTYYKGVNKPEANFQHISQGYIGTALSWAASGYRYASWTYSIDPDGKVYQHLDHEDGGFQAGIGKYRYDSEGNVYAYNPYPTWPLFKGWQEEGAPNVNCYSLGTEHMGFAANGGYTEPQEEASLKLNQWLSREYGWPMVEAHFPPHAAVALIDRANDFGYPEVRAAYYAKLTGGAGMATFTDNHQELLYGLVDLLLGRANGVEYVNDIERLIVVRDAVANDMRYNLGLSQTQAKVAELAQAVAAMATGSVGQSSGANSALEIAEYLQKLGDGYKKLGIEAQETGLRLATMADAQNDIPRH